jgi:hypothetical protein
VSRYYSIDGEPMTLLEWAASVDHREDSRIGWDEKDGIRVSTVWLGLDHQWGNGPPLIFETMIFGGDHDEEQWRYSTREQAEAGHRRACELAFGEVPA